MNVLPIVITRLVLVIHGAAFGINTIDIAWSEFCSMDPQNKSWDDGIRGKCRLSVSYKCLTALYRRLRRCFAPRDLCPLAVR